MDGVGEEHRKEFHSGADDPRILGSDSFTEAALSTDEGAVRRVTMDQIEKMILRLYRVGLDQLRSPFQQRQFAEARAMLAWAARRSGAGNLEQVARLVNRGAGSLSSAVRRLVDRAGENAEVKGRFAEVESAIRKLNDLEA
jgi:chromosomal replication initiation ATPase DnaA